MAAAFMTDGASLLATSIKSQKSGGDQEGPLENRASQDPANR